MDRKNTNFGLLAYCLIFLLDLVLVTSLPDIRKSLGRDRIFKIDIGIHISLDLSSFTIVGRDKDYILVKSRLELLTEVYPSPLDITEEYVSTWEKNHLNNAEDYDFLHDFFAQYRDLDDITSYIEQQVLESNGLAVRKNIGRSSEGRPIHVVEIGDSSLPLIYVLCNVHAAEWLTPLYCAYMIEELVKDDGHEILETFSFALVPTGNPDGYVYSRREDPFWRKTRNVNPSIENKTCYGTDINRNWANNHCGAGTSNDPCSDYYCGPKPFSAPETLALETYAKNAMSRIIAMNDVHSYGAMWLSPLGYKSGYPPAVDFDRMDKCMSAAIRAATAVHHERFISGPAADILEPGAGASDDHFYFTHGIIYSFTIELRGISYQPNAKNITLSNEEIFAGMIAEFLCIAQLEGIGKFGTITKGEWNDENYWVKLNEWEVLVTVGVTLILSLLSCFTMKYVHSVSFKEEIKKSTQFQTRVEPEL